MKKLSVLHKYALWVVLVTAVSFHPASAQDVSKSQILQNKADQQDIRLRTAAVVTQIQSLIDELTANGISGGDIKVLNATKAALTNLSGPEMERVVTSLQNAGETADPASSQQSVVNAYADQKGIILQFRQILNDYEQRQAASELPLRFKDLSDHQTETMLTSASVARATAGKSANELTTMQQTTEQIVQADQQAIGNETTLAEDQLNKASQTSTEDDAKPLQQAQEDLKSGVLQQALGRANDDLKAGQLLKALNEQKTARDELRRIAQDLNPPTNAVDALTDKAAALAKLIDEQKSLLDQTNVAVGITPRVPGLADKQGALVDETNSLQQDLQSLSATAANLVKDAIDPEQISRATLSRPQGSTFAQAANSQQDAIAKLELAQQQLQQQVADAQKAAADAAENPVARLQDLQKQIETAMQQQNQLSTQTAPPSNNSTPPNPTAVAQAQQQQSQLQQQTSSLQQAAQPLSLPASQALAEAAKQMNQAQQDLTDPSKTANAQTAQQAAQTALAQADQQVTQQIAQAQQQPPNPEALAVAANSLQQAQNSVSSAIADTNPHAETSPPSAKGTGTPPASKPPSMSAAATALAAAARDTQAAAATPSLPGSAAVAVQQAQAAIAQGEQQANKGDARGTASSAAAAEQSLAQAQAAVAMAQAGLAAAGTPASGTPPTPDETPAQPGLDGKAKDEANALSGGSTDKGTQHDTTGDGKFVSVASRDRAAIDQTQEEKRPQEYAPMIDQYMKNLADQSSSSSP